MLTVNQFFTAGQVVAQSDLLTVLPHHFMASTGIADQLCTRRLPLELPVVHVDMLWHRRHAVRPAHAWLREALVAAAGSVYTSVPVQSV